MLKIGSVIDGKYKVLNEIGHGGMSTVYLAINEKANKTWAIKEVRKKYNKDFNILKQSLIVETNLLKQLRHSNLPTIVDVIDSDENFLIVMDYIEGNTLEKLLYENGAQNQEKVVSWAIQLCDVLDYLHSRPAPIIYRDMKPSNIMLKSDGNVVLIDFGTAREFKERNIADTTCLGTQGYAAPEQFGGMGQTDGRTDIYCLGATMYHLLTGHNPSEPPYEMYPITHWNNKLSNGLEKIVQKCIQKNPEDRYQNARELKYALEHYRDLETQTQQRYRRRIALFGLFIFLSFICVIGSIGFSKASSHKKKYEYETILERAAYTTNSLEAIKMYMDAIDIDPVKAEAYHNFYDKIVEDGVFDDNEEDVLLHLNASTDMHLQSFEQKNQMEYAEFCYEMGNAYWYYYIHEESRQSNAVSWFETASRYFTENEQKAMEYKRSCLYVQIGRFYKKVISAQIEGNDKGIYGEYWNTLCELKALNDENPDREMITLRMYREIVSRVTEYARYLYEDGIDKKEILEMFAEIEKDMYDMQQNATSSVNNEIEKIYEIMEIAYKMVSSSYKE